MRSKMTRLLFTFAAWLITSLGVRSSGLGATELEKIFSASHDASPPLVEVPTTSHSAAQPVHLERSWSSILQQLNRNDRQPAGGSVTSPARLDLTLALSSPLTEHTTDQRREMLERVQHEFYSITDAGPSRFKPPKDSDGHLIQPFEHTLDPQRFQAILYRITSARPRYGFYPYEIGSTQYLLQLALSGKDEFRMLNGFVTKNPKHVWYYVYNVKSMHGTEGIFEYLGTFRGPHRERNAVYQKFYLGSPTVELSDVWALSGASFKARAGPYPPS